MSQGITEYIISAEKAQAMGLINRTTSKENLSKETLELAQTVGEKLGSVVKIGKKAFYKQLSLIHI